MSYCYVLLLPARSSFLTCSSQGKSGLLTPLDLEYCYNSILKRWQVWVLPLEQSWWLVKYVVWFFYICIHMHTEKGRKITVLHIPFGLLFDLPLVGQRFLAGGFHSLVNFVFFHFVLNQLHFLLLSFKEMSVMQVSSRGQVWKHLQLFQDDY